MLTHWDSLLRADCEVVQIKEKQIYPIFKVGYTSLTQAAEKVYVNSDIAECKDIIILLRNPDDRFVSGVNQYCWIHSLDVDKTWNQVKNNSLIDRHFAPQYVWILHLFKFYKGNITLKPFHEISNITTIHRKPKGPMPIRPKQSVPLLKEFVESDHKLMEKYLNKTLNISELVQEYKNVLS
jgi:hypothetical protein